jgi:hypothetical protein
VILNTKYLFKKVVAMGVSEKLLQIIVSGVIIFRHNWKGPTVLAVAGKSRHHEEPFSRRLGLEQACIQVGLDYHIYQKEEKNTHTHITLGCLSLPNLWQ